MFVFPANPILSCAELFLPRGSLVSDIPAGDGKLMYLFYSVLLLTARDSEAKISAVAVVPAIEALLLFGFPTFLASFCCKCTCCWHPCCCFHSCCCLRPYCSFGTPIDSIASKIIYCICKLYVYLISTLKANIALVIIVTCPPMSA